MLTDETALKISFLHIINKRQTNKKRKTRLSKCCVSMISTYRQRRFCLYPLSHFTKHLLFSTLNSETPVPVFTYTPYTLSLHAHPWYQTAMNHKQLTSSHGLNERHASAGNRIKARFVLFSLSNNNRENQVFACARETTMRSACVLRLHYAASQCTFWQIVCVHRLLF